MPSNNLIISSVISIFLSAYKIGLTIALKNTMSILYADKKIDITDEIIRLLDGMQNENK